MSVDIAVLREVGAYGVRVLGTLDLRICRACLAHDGTIYSVDDWERLQPLPCNGCTCEPHCRCTDVAIVRSSDAAPDAAWEARKAALIEQLDALDKRPDD